MISNSFKPKASGAISSEEKIFRSNYIKEKLKNATMNINGKFPTLLSSSNFDKQLYFHTMHGISATGKGTRLFHLLNYLIKNNHKYEYIVSQGAKWQSEEIAPPKTLGIAFPDIGLIVFGKLQVSSLSRLISWSCYDWLQNHLFLNHEDLIQVIITLYNECGYNKFALEGYVDMPHARKIDEKLKYHGCDSDPFYHSQYFMYSDSKEGFEELTNRVIGRSGKSIKGTCFNQNSNICKVKNHINFDSYKGVYYIDNFEAPQHVFTERFNLVYGIEDESITDEKYDVLRRYDSFEESVSKYIDLYIEQELVKNFYKTGNIRL